MRSVRSRLLYLLSLTIGLALWELASRLVSSLVLAPPSRVILRLVEGIASGEFLQALIGSLGVLSIGYVAAVAVGLPLGFLLGRSRTAADVAEPVVTAIYAVPPVALVPFIVIWFGLFFEARVALVFIMAIFEIVVTTAVGVRSIDPSLIAVGRAFAASRTKLACSVLLPASLPFVFTALRVGLVRAINGMITAELFFAAVNLGKVMKDASGRFDTASILAVVLLLALVGLVLQEGLKAAQARLMPWHIRKSV
jgi:NitT/TauT family transport system permease protein